MRSTEMPADDKLPGAARTARRMTLLLLAVTLLVPATWILSGPQTAVAEEEGKDEKKGAPASKDAPKKDEPAAGPERKPILPAIQEDPKAFKDLVEAARQYFDLDEEQWKGRTALMAQLTEMAKQGHYFLRDMDALRWLVYQSRSFDPPLSDRKWQKSVGVQEAKKLGGTVAWIKAEELLTCAYSIPRSYWKLKDMRGKYPRPDPYPFLLTMHEKRDFANQKYPGDVLLKRRWPKKGWDDLYDNWIIMCPVAAAGNYLNKAGMVRDIVFKNPFAEFWRHYNIDFDRIILDGDKQAFTVGTSMPVFFAGIVLRGKWTLDKAEEKELVKNLAPVPLYVVQNPKLAKQLEEAGHKQVTAGVGGATLMKWMNERRRVMPKEFSWVVQPNRVDQVLPHWINLDNPNWAAPKRELTVSVLDTEKDPNTIRIKAEGINTLSIFLSDDLVDLDRKLRVEINGHVEYDKVVPLVDPLMKTVGRDFDFLFNREPVRIRSSMFFGWLAPSRIVSLNVRPPRKVVTPKDDPKKEAPKASPEDIDRAGRFLQRAKIFAGKGNVERALQELEKVLELPETEHHADALKLKKELEAKVEAGK